VNDLLDLAIAAHGGWERWQQIDRLTAHAAIGGAAWHIKGWPDVYADIHAAVDTRRQHTELSPFLTKGQYAVYEPDRTAIIADGAIIEQREAPRTSFAGHAMMTPWDAQQLIYFGGYALWTYLSTPFLFKSAGFQTEEVEPWDEDGEIWRRLKVTFPFDMHSHSTEQTFYFDAYGLLRRHDYSVEVMGGTTSAHYASDHQSFGGLVFPTKRRVYAAGPDNRPMRDQVAVTIDILGIETA
jgi:hypothetical protein